MPDVEFGIKDTTGTTSHSGMWVGFSLLFVGLLVGLVLWSFFIRPIRRAAQLDAIGVEYDIVSTAADWMPATAQPWFDRVDYIYTYQDEGISQPLPSLRSMRHLYRVDFVSDIQQNIDLRRCPKLEEVCLWIREGLEHSSVTLRGLPSLEHVDITFDNKGAFDLRECAALRHLAVHGGIVQVEGTGGIKRLEISGGTRLERVSDWQLFAELSSLQIGPGISAFPLLPKPENLLKLRLNSFPIEEVPWSSLVGLERLEVYDGTCRKELDLRLCTNLSKLHFRGFIFENETVLRLPPSVDQIFLAANKGTLVDASLFAFQEPCAHLSVRGSHVTGLADRILDGIESLSLYGGGTLDEAGWERLAASVTLRDVVICSDTPLPSYIWHSLSKMPSLHELHVRSGKSMPPLDGFPSLESVFLEWGTELKLVEVPTLSRVKFTDFERNTVKEFRVGHKVGEGPRLVPVDNDP